MKFAEVMSQILQYDNCIDVFFDNFDRARPVILFGAGYALNSLLSKFEIHDFRIACIGDNDLKKDGMQINSDKKTYEIKTLERCEKDHPDAYYIVTAPMFFNQICQSLIKNVGYDRVSKIDFECGHYFSGRDFKNYLATHKDQLLLTYEILSDDLSRDTLKQVIKAHMTGERNDFESACWEQDDWYMYRSMFQGQQGDVYLDCGAYDGDTIFLFEKYSRGKYGKIFGFEPNSKIFPLLEENVRNKNLSNTMLVNKGVSNFRGTIEFAQQDVYSKINKKSSNHRNIETIDVVKIDEYFHDQPISMIKMDIEGGELDALLGAAETIKKYKPRLAICLYHDYTHFIEIPNLLKKTRLDYKFYIRHHSKSCTDTVLYAI